MRSLISQSLRCAGCLGLVCLINSALFAENVVTESSGPSSNRVDVVFVGDGYTEFELELYHQHLDDALAYIFEGSEEPFNRYGNFFNFHRIEVISNESGADFVDPNGAPQNNVFVDTALDARYFFDGVTERLLSINQDAALEIENRSIPTSVDIDLRVSTINSERYGGAGGDPFGSERFYVAFAGGSFDAFEIALHEIAHPLGDLADEYILFNQAYPGQEPFEANVTIDSTGEKWSHWFGYEQPELGPIGVYEGGRYYAEGIYRPSENSKMRELGLPFDAVAREQIVLAIYEHVEPVDSHTPVDDVIGFADAVNVQVVDPEVISLDWVLNGTLLDTSSLADQSQFAIENFIDLGILPGEYDLDVVATDKTDWIRLENRRPRQSVTWQVDYFPGDFNDNRLTDAEDIDLLTAAVGGDDLGFDLNQDGIVDQLDREVWVAANQTFFGDLDLDRDVDFADFLQFSESFGDPTLTGWADGNWDGVGAVDFPDFLLLAGNFGRVAAATHSVPEPGSLTCVLGVGITMLLRRRREKHSAE